MVQAEIQANFNKEATETGVIELGERNGKGSEETSSNYTLLTHA